MDDTNGKASDGAHTPETEAEARERTLNKAVGIFQRLIVTASDTVGFPSPNTSRPAIEQGVRLTKEFLRISNQQVHVLIVELVSAVADLKCSMAILAIRMVRRIRGVLLHFEVGPVRPLRPVSRRFCSAAKVALTMLA